jgi:hypothetical protein
MTSGAQDYTKRIDVAVQSALSLVVSFDEGIPIQKGVSLSGSVETALDLVDVTGAGKFLGGYIIFKNIAAFGSFTDNFLACLIDGLPSVAPSFAYMNTYGVDLPQPFPGKMTCFDSTTYAVAFSLTPGVAFRESFKLIFYNPNAYSFDISSVLFVGVI